jgi:hypothetical protein
MTSRKHSFDKYHADHVKNREEHVQTAAKLLAGANFKSITLLAKSVAKVVYQLELKNAKDGQEVKPINHTTLIRKGSKYRHILLAQLEGVSDEGRDQSEIDLELDVLRLQCASLQHDNDLFRGRLDSLGDSISLDAPSEASEEHQVADDIKMLIKIIDGLKGELPDLFDVVELKDISQYQPTTGLYGPNNKIAEYSDLERLTELRNEYK